MLEFLENLFSSPVFMPHGHCYLWKPGLVWLQVISNGTIGLAYLGIALTLAYLVKRGQYVPFKGMALAFSIFIITCGLTHFLDIYVIWKPVYWLDGTVRAVTAVASVGTALLLPPLVPRAISLAQSAKAASERGIQLQTALQDAEAMYAKMSELEQIKTQFFSNISHELRTPLTLIMGPAEKLLASAIPGSEQHRDAELILRNARTLLQHVNDLLDVSRLEAGKMQVHYASVDLTALVKLVAGNFDGLARERNIQYRLETPDSLTVHVDQDKVQRIVLNLLANAFKFTPPGGTIRCTVGTEQQHGREATFIDVADSGPGVREDQREIIFERFRQVDGGDTRRFGGVGLGLAISDELATLHGGQISVADAPEGGALFHVHLPRFAPEGAPLESGSDIASSPAMEHAARQAVDELTQGQAIETPARSGERPLVLVIEDNPEVSRFVCESLADEYRTESAMDGGKGLEMALALKPDLVLSDIMMPVMSGDDLVRELRRRPEVDSTPILLLSARADEHLRARLLREGAQDYVVKPFSLEELRARVANLVMTKRARDILQAELELQTRDLELLAREVSRRKQELAIALDSMRVARAQAEQASELKSNFLRMVSHELRTPLSALRLLLERMRLAAAAMPPGAGELIPRMLGQTARLHELIESLLHYARAQGGRLSTEIASFDVVRLAQECLDGIRPAAEARGLSVELAAADDLPALSSDPGLVRLILANLLGNAVKFTSEGFVRLTITCAEDMLRLAIADSGRGIPADMQTRLFEPFSPGEPTRHKHREGLGLGLALVRDLTSSLGGTIAVFSVNGKGSTFVVELPFLPATDATKA